MLLGQIFNTEKPGGIDGPAYRQGLSMINHDNQGLLSL